MRVPREVWRYAAAETAAAVFRGICSINRCTGLFDIFFAVEHGEEGRGERAEARKRVGRC